MDEPRSYNELLQRGLQIWDLPDTPIGLIGAKLNLIERHEEEQK